MQMICVLLIGSMRRLKIFIDHPDASQREVDMKRFSITDDNEMSDDYQLTLFESDDFGEIMKFINKY